MFILLKNEYENDYGAPITSVVGLFGSQDEAEKACKHLESTNDEDISYEVVESTEYKCFEDFWVAHMEDKFQKKVKEMMGTAEEMKDVAKWQAEASEWKAKYEAKVKEIRNLEATINRINARRFCDE